MTTTARDRARDRVLLDSRFPRHGRLRLAAIVNLVAHASESKGTAAGSGGQRQQSSERQVGI